jgi:hypothetical protein
MEERGVARHQSVTPHVALVGENLATLSALLLFEVVARTIGAVTKLHASKSHKGFTTPLSSLPYR